MKTQYASFDIFESIWTGDIKSGSTMAVDHPRHVMLLEKLVI